MRYETNFRSIRDEVSPDEWRVRVDLAACYRLVDYYGMTDLTYNHITARVPAPQHEPRHHILINLYGLTYKEITASSLAKIDLDGELVWKPGTDYYVNRAGYVIHGAVHRARTDVTCVLHTHTRAGMAVAAMKCGLLPISQTSIRFEGHIGYHDYEGPAVELAERERLVRNLGPPAGRRWMPWLHAPISSCLQRKSSRKPRTSTSPARGGRTGCSSGRRCCACWKPSRRARPFRRTICELFELADTGSTASRVGGSRCAGTRRCPRPR